MVPILAQGKSKRFDGSHVAATRGSHGTPPHFFDRNSAEAQQVNVLGGAKNHILKGFSFCLFRLRLFPDCKM